MSRTPMRLLERGDSLDRLDGMLNDAAAGVGTLALVAGEAGAGKTSLLMEAAHRTRNRAVVLLGGCDPLSTPRPLSPLHDIARDPRAGLSGVLDGHDSPLDIFSAVLDRLTDARPPVLLIIEDIHWADEATLDFVRFIGRRIGGLRAVIACSFRDDEIAADHPAQLVIGDLAPRPTTHLLRVPPLTLDAVSQLSGRDGEEARRLHRVTGGNAFYVTEIVAEGEALPRSIQDAVLARVGRLDAESRMLVEAVATAPRDVELHVALEVSGVKPEAADEAVVRGVITATDNRLRFRHELARAAVEHATPPARLTGLHRNMIEVLVRDRPTDLARLAHHSIRAHDPELIAKFAPAAAAQASSQGAHREAAQFLTLALEHGGTVAAETEATWRESLAAELGILDRHAEALEQRDAAVLLRRELADQEKLAMSLCGLSTSRWATGDAAGSKRANEEALTVLERARSSYPHAYALYAMAHNSMLRRQYSASIGHGAKAIDMAREVGDVDLVTTTMIITAAAELVMGDSTLGVTQMRAAISRAEAAGHSGNRALGWWMLGSGGGEARVYETAIEALEQEINIALRTDDDYGVAYSHAWLARIAFDQGRWDDAERYAELVPPSSGRGVIAPITALGAIGRSRVRRGDRTGPENLELALTIGGDVSLQYVWSPLCGLAELAWLEGRSESIPGILESVFDEAASSDSPWAKGEVSTWMWRAGAVDSPLPGSARAFSALIDGEWEESASLWEEIGCPYEQALALAEGDREAMLRGLAILDGLAARPAAGILRSRLREAGVQSIPRGPRATTMLNPVGLTARQVEVLRLMAAGLSNAEIADRLYISKKTTEHHVSAVLSKLGASSRAQALAKASSLSLTQN